MKSLTAFLLMFVFSACIANAQNSWEDCYRIDCSQMLDVVITNKEALQCFTDDTIPVRISCCASITKVGDTLGIAGYCPGPTWKEVYSFPFVSESSFPGYKAYDNPKNKRAMDILPVRYFFINAVVVKVYEAAYD